MGTKNSLSLFQKIISKAVQGLRIKFFNFISADISKGKPVRRQPTLIIGSGEVQFFGKVVVGYYPSPQFYSSYAHIEARRPASRIIIKSGTHINNNFCIICDHTWVQVDENCRIGMNVEIYDSDFHGIEISDRSKSLPGLAKPVHIHSEVFIGSNVKILKGVTIGRGTVIASGSIVTKSIPAMVVAAGNPARVVRNLDEDHGH